MFMWIFYIFAAINAVQVRTRQYKLKISNYSKIYYNEERTYITPSIESY